MNGFWNKGVLWFSYFRNVANGQRKMGYILRDEACQWDRGLFSKNISNYFSTCLHVYNYICISKTLKAMLWPFNQTGLVFSDTGSSANSRGTVCSRCLHPNSRCVQDLLQRMKKYIETLLWHQANKRISSLYLGLFGACCLLYVSVYSATWIEWYLPNKSLKWSWWMFLFTFLMMFLNPPCHEAAKLMLMDWQSK